MQQMHLRTSNLMYLYLDGGGTKAPGSVELHHGQDGIHGDSRFQVDHGERHV